MLSLCFKPLQIAVVVILPFSCHAKMELRTEADESQCSAPGDTTTDKSNKFDVEAKLKDIMTQDPNPLISTLGIEKKGRSGPSDGHAFHGQCHKLKGWKISYKILGLQYLRHLRRLEKNLNPWKILIFDEDGDMETEEIRNKFWEQSEEVKDELDEENPKYHYDHGGKGANLFPVASLSKTFTTFVAIQFWERFSPLLSPLHSLKDIAIILDDQRWVTNLLQIPEPSEFDTEIDSKFDIETNSITISHMLSHRFKGPNNLKKWKPT